MIVRVLTFARIREILGHEHVERHVRADATAADVYDVLASEFPALHALRASTRFVHNGAFAPPDTPLGDGDELGLLPPYGGG